MVGRAGARNTEDVGGPSLGVDVGVLGRVVHTAGALPAVHPVSYALCGQEIIFRTAQSSILRAAMLRQVLAFEVDDVDPTTRTGWSVLAIGKAHRVTDTDRLTDLATRLPPPWGAGRAAHHHRPSRPAAHRVSTRPRRSPRSVATHGAGPLRVPTGVGIGLGRAWATHHRPIRRRRDSTEPRASAPSPGRRRTGTATKHGRQAGPEWRAQHRSASRHQTTSQLRSTAALT